MGANDKLRARYRALEQRRKKNADRARRDFANRADAEAIRVALHRVGSVDAWERKRVEQALENIRADAIRRRAGYFHGLQDLVLQMRGRGLTVAQVAELVGVDLREIQSELRRARDGDKGAWGTESCHSARSRSADVGPEATALVVDPMSDGVERDPDASETYDPTRCIRCGAAMLDEDAAPRRGRRRLYCSDTCRRDASAARNAAQRYGAPIRVIEVPKAAASQKRSAETAEPREAVAPMDAANKVLDDGEALRGLLARLVEQARLKKLDRATLTAARELSNAVDPHRD